MIRVDAPDDAVPYIGGIEEIYGPIEVRGVVERDVDSGEVWAGIPEDRDDDVEVRGGVLGV